MSERQNVAYTVEDVRKQLKPLSTNGFAAAFQKLGRWWLGGWYNFAEKHPKGAALLYKIFFFFIFSQGVTIWQYLVMTFLPYLFGSLASISFVWPAIELGTFTNVAGEQVTLWFAIFNEPAKQLADGTWMATAGLGNFLAFEIAVFTAQCINFPLQRNITFRSHGNPWYQAMWYFIGWVLISIFVNAVWGIIVPFVRDLWLWDSVIWNLLKTFLTGGVSMIIFFFIFLVIFPDNEKLAKKAREKYEQAKAAGADEGTLAQLESAMRQAEHNALLTVTEREEIKAKSLANAKAIRYFAMESAIAKVKGTDKQAEAEKRLAAAFADATAAIKQSEDAACARQAALAGQKA